MMRIYQLLSYCSYLVNVLLVTGGASWLFCWCLVERDKLSVFVVYLAQRNQDTDRAVSMRLFQHVLNRQLTCGFFVKEPI